MIAVVATTTAAVSVDWLDPTLVGIIVASTFLGLWRGLLRSIASLAGIILGALFAGQVAAYINPALKHAHIQHPAINATWAFVIAFLAILIAVEVGANVVVWLERLMLLGWVDRLGGAAFGLARGVLLSMILLAGLAQFNAKSLNSEIHQAQVAGWLWRNIPAITAMLPAGMRQSTIRLIHDKAPFLGEPLSRTMP